MFFSFPIIIWFLRRWSRGIPTFPAPQNPSGVYPRRINEAHDLTWRHGRKLGGSLDSFNAAAVWPFLKFLAHGGKMFLRSIIFSRGASILNNFERNNIFFSLSIGGQCFDDFFLDSVFASHQLGAIFLWNGPRPPTVIMVHYMLYTLYTYIFLWMSMILKYQSIIVSRQNDPVNQKNCPTSKYIKGFKIVRYYKRAGGKILI